MHRRHNYCTFFFFNDTATTEIYTLSLHDALPICAWSIRTSIPLPTPAPAPIPPPVSRGKASVYGWFDGKHHWEDSGDEPTVQDRKSTRLNSSHQIISYAVFCLKKKKPTSSPPTLG